MKTQQHVPELAWEWVLIVEGVGPSSSLPGAVSRWTRGANNSDKGTTVKKNDRSIDVSTGLSAQELALVAALKEENAELRKERDEWRKRYERLHIANKTEATKDTPQNTFEAIAMREIFAEWQQLFGYPDARLTKARRTIILARLRERYSVVEIGAVLIAASCEPSTRGTVPGLPTMFDDLTTILQPTRMGPNCALDGAVLKSRKLDSELHQGVGPEDACDGVEG
jgi:hypothetical protein